MKTGRRFFYRFIPAFGLTLATLLSGAAPEATGQTTDKSYVSVQATVEPANVKPGGQALLKLTIKIAGDAHINSNAPKDPNLIPTIFTPRPTAGVVWGRPQYPEPTEVTEWYSVDPLVVFTNGAVIVVPLTIGPAATGTLELSGMLLAQACDHEQCYPPRRLAVTAPLTITGVEPVPAKVMTAQAPSEKTNKAAEPMRAQTSATDFSFTDFDGKSRKLSEFRGKVVLPQSTITTSFIEVIRRLLCLENSFCRRAGFCCWPWGFTRNTPALSKAT